MPCYDFICNNVQCLHVLRDVVIKHAQLGDSKPCPKCNKNMIRQFPTSIHTKVGMSVDGADVGKVIQEKNERLKKAWEGYSYEEQNLRESIEKKVQKRATREA
jgi:hypothetical protein